MTARGLIFLVILCNLFDIPLPLKKNRNKKHSLEASLLMFSISCYQYLVLGSASSLLPTNSLKCKGSGPNQDLMSRNEVGPTYLCLNGSLKQNFETNCFILHYKRLDNLLVVHKRQEMITIVYIYYHILVTSKY